MGMLSILLQPLFAGESALTKTYQPLDGLGAGRIMVTDVACHDWYSHSGMPISISLICAPNIPPTNNPKQAKSNLNLAPISGLKLHYTEVGKDFKYKFTLDARGLQDAKPQEWNGENVVRATLECLRRCLPEKYKQAQIELLEPEGDVGWLRKIVSAFNKHDRAKTFFEDKS